MSNEELKNNWVMICAIIALGRMEKLTICVIRFVRVHIVMKRWKCSWMKTKISLMMMQIFN